MAPKSFWAPRNWEGSIVRFAKMPDGGAKVQAWVKGGWKDVDIPASKLGPLGEATPEELRAAGISEEAARAT